MAAVVSSTLQRLKLSVYVNLFWHSKSPQESTSLKPGRLILVPSVRLKSLAPLGGESMLNFKGETEFCNKI